MNLLSAPPPSPQAQAASILDAWRDGQTPDTLAALSQFPQLRLDKTALIDLAYEEYCIRRERGEAINDGEFCAHFPDVRDTLHGLIDAHRRLESAPPETLPKIDWPEAGQEFEGFRLVRPLGRGGFGRVFLAWDPDTAREVALKIAATDGTEAKRVGKFLHPNVVPIYDARELNTGLSYVCMPYLGCATLADLLDARPPSGLGAPAAPVLRSLLARAGEPGAAGVPLFDPLLQSANFGNAVAALALGVAQGLAFLHSHKVRHRDLKPSNVLLGWDARPIILDFNLSEDPRVDLPRFGGTLPYMAPEQIQTGLGLPPVGPFDEKADVFSLGVILYESLVGRHPFGTPGAPRPVSGKPLRQREAAVWQLGRQSDGVPPPVAPGLDPALAGLVSRCLSFRPQDRPTAAAVVEELTRLRRRPHRLKRWMIRRRGLVIAALLLSSAGVAAGAGWLAAREPWEQRVRHKGVVALNAGDNLTAVQQMDALIAATPDNADAHFLRGVALARRGKWEQALVDLQHSAELKPDGRTSAMMAFCQAQWHNMEAAHFRATDAINRGFDGAAVYTLRGVSRLHSRPVDDRFKDAARDFDEAISRDPKLPQAYYQRAKLALDAGETADLSRARADIQKALDLGLRFQMLYWTAANITIRQPNRGGQYYAETVEYLTQAVAYGFKPARIQNNPMFKGLQPRSDFQELLRNPPIQSAAPGDERELPDPLSGQVE